MNNIEYKIITLTEENINLLERLRYNAYNMNPNDYPPENTFHTKQLKERKYLVFGCFLNNQLIGGCYTSNSHNTFYIEQLFIAKKYQKSNLHLGTNLLKFTLQNKKIAEQYFNTKFYFSASDPNNNSTNLCKSIGYKEQNLYFRKRL